jgi:type IV pilus assembly protein PilE
MKKQQAVVQQRTGYAMMRQLKMRRAEQGFTLVELMITVVVISLLAMVAVPAYNDSIRKARRSDAKSTLTEAASRMEQYFLDNKTYTTDMKALGYASSPAQSTDSFYLISSAACSGGAIATCYELTAAPPSGGAQEDDTGCTSMTLDSNGSQSPESCW